MSDKAPTNKVVDNAEKKVNILDEKALANNEVCMFFIVYICLFACLISSFPIMVNNPILEC